MDSLVCDEPSIDPPALGDPGGGAAAVGAAAFGAPAVITRHAPKKKDKEVKDA